MLRALSHRSLSRRSFLQLAAGTAAASRLPESAWAQAAAKQPLRSAPLLEVGYDQVIVTSTPHLAQLQNTHTVLMGLGNDSLLKPFRAMIGQPAPGEELGGWYQYVPDYNYKTDKAGLAPSANFGQWVSALCRYYAATGDQATRNKVLELNRLFAATITPAYYANNRFPAYCFDKLVCGLMDSHRLADDPQAFPLLNATANAAVQQLPGRAIPRETPWRTGKDISWDWDESYTVPENLYLVYSMGAGDRYLSMANQYLLESYFDPLAHNQNVLGGKHAYSYVNALCSAMQAYLVAGSQMHLDAARNAFDMLEAQSFATGGWGPDELLRAPGSGEVFDSLTRTHNSFETPCGSYAHMKLTRYLLRVTRDGRYGDSMERVMYNTVLGAEPLQPDGRAFYYADCNFHGARVYSGNIWPCCSGTLPQVAADYGINTYLREPGSVWVNLYIPSLLRWTQGSARLQLEQLGDYPYNNAVEFRITASTPAPFTLQLRIPAWARSPRLTVNDRPAPIEVHTGFAAITRTWKTGDRVELELPAQLRLETFNPAHPETVALLYGPLVLFARTPPATPSTTTPTTWSQPAITGKQALAARRTGRTEWTIDTTAAGPLQLSPFTELGSQPYTTYLTITT